ncbi:MAG: hypothetical protein A2Z25_02650 [Planctomycetes bacterium RBG_16_55_9]|nr:MAG: hypothetical protein A2Z25_02650 [Planctomycetes bacterium RBG_16_55_9]
MKFMSRFCDQKGHLVDYGGLYYSPHAFLSAVLRKAVGHRPKKPWISYRAINHLSGLICPNWRVLEYGAGMSTLWLARRCQHVVSIEGNEFWFRTIDQMLKSQKISNVDLRLRKNDSYHIIDDIPDHYVDFALVDGWNRDECMRTALCKVRRGGYIYLDNTDQYVNNPKGHTRIAENILLSHLKQIGATPTYFVDFCPANFFVSEGLLARV